MLSPAATASVAKIARQPESAMMPEPASGASIGETEMISMTSAISLVACGPVCMSRMMARGITMAAAPPSACTTRAATSEFMSGARAQPMEPAANSVRPAISGGLRPTMSATGP